MQVDVSEAGKCLPGLVAAAERGEDVILARDGEPMARIVHYQRLKVQPRGAWKGKVRVSPNWDSAETNAEVAELFDESTRLDFSDSRRS